MSISRLSSTVVAATLVAEGVPAGVCSPGPFGHTTAAFVPPPTAIACGGSAPGYRWVDSPPPAPAPDAGGGESGDAGSDGLWQ
ncbi:MAG TPA: hypothetical protein VND93_31155 [Myxococcales bacterium]|jgi:hypothetical protein|nr:hypothetical protein [Myxococcales bacterium]